MELPKTALPIKNTLEHWVDIDGSIYTIDRRGESPEVVKKIQRTISGLKCCHMYDTSLQKVVIKRVHRVVAETFIPNPNHLPAVKPRNGVTTDNRVENVYWSIIEKLSQKNVDMSIQKPVVMFETATNKLLGQYENIQEAAKETGISEKTVARQVRYKRPVNKPYYFRYADDPSAEPCQLVGLFDYDTDQLRTVFLNETDAASSTDIPEETIRQQCDDGKPQDRLSEYYFKRLAE